MFADSCYLSNFETINHHITEKAGVISREAQGVEPPCLNYCSFWRAHSSLKILVLALLFKEYWPCYHSDMVIGTFLIVDYTISVFN